MFAQLVQQSVGDLVRAALQFANKNLLPKNEHEKDTGDIQKNVENKKGEREEDFLRSVCVSMR
jgi:hypothetical protein